MNRRQEIACWVFGLLLALATAGFGEALNAFRGWFHPAPSIAIVGALAIYSLRRSGEPAQPRVLLAGLGAACLLAIAGAIHAVGSAMPDTLQLERELASIAKNTDEVSASIQDVADSIDDLRTGVEGGE